MSCSIMSIENNYLKLKKAVFNTNLPPKPSKIAFDLC